MASNSFMTFGIGQGDENVSSKSEKYKGETGRTDRISFAWWPGIDQGRPDMDAKTPQFIGAPRNYIEGVGYFINKGPEYTRIAGGNAPRMAIATVIIKWPTDRKGTLDLQRLKDGEFQVMPWIFSEDKYNAFNPIHTEFPFGKHDLTVSCTDTKYQKMTFSPCKENMLRKLYEANPDSPVVQKILTQVQAVLSNIQGEIGRDLTLDQIREKMAGGSGAATGGGGVAAVAPATTQDIDNLVGDLLDV